MIHCPLCHRLRRPNGLHICLSKRSDFSVVPAPNGAQRDAATAAGFLGHETRGAGPLHISSFRLPGAGPAAQVWNQLRRTAP